MCEKHATARFSRVSRILLVHCCLGEGGFPVHPFPIYRSHFDIILTVRTGTLLAS